MVRDMVALGVSGGLFLGFSFLLMKATRVVLEALGHLVLTGKVGRWGVVSLVLAFATTIPELMVGILAGSRQQSALALGNVLGSNIANLSLVLGGAAVISGGLQAHDQFLKREVFYVFLAGSLPLLLLLDGVLTRMDGFILLATYGLYNLTVLEHKRKALAKYEIGSSSLWQRLFITVRPPRLGKSLAQVAVGVVVIIMAAEMMVRLALSMAQQLNLPVLLMGLLLVAVGTSLPELLFAIRAVKRREVAMAFGNVLGSVVSNSTVVLGVAVLMAPVKLTQGLAAYLLATIVFMGMFVLFWAFVWTKHRLEQWEGGVLVGAYLLFAWWELTRLGRVGDLF